MHLSLIQLQHKFKQNFQYNAKENLETNKIHDCAVGHLTLCGGEIESNSFA